MDRPPVVFRAELSTVTVISVSMMPGELKRILVELGERELVPTLLVDMLILGLRLEGE